MRAADAGDLADRGKLAAQVQRMLKDSRTIDRSSQFLSEWLDLGRLANLRPDAKKFPNWDAQLATDMRDETLAYFREVAWKQNRPLSDLLNAQLTYATPRLAEHYGLTSLSEDISQYDLSSVAGRGGILTQGSVLTVGGDGASMVSRAVRSARFVARHGERTAALRQHDTAAYESGPHATRDRRISNRRRELRCLSREIRALGVRA